MSRRDPTPNEPIRPLDHLPLVRTIARAYKKKRPHCGLEVEDLVQEGWFGLVAACEHFDPGMGYKFSTYAIWWIREAIIVAIEVQPHPVRVPRIVRNDFNREKKGTLAGLDAAPRARLDAARPFLDAPPIQEAASNEDGPSLEDLAIDHREPDPAAADLDGADDLRPLRCPITDERLRLHDALAALPERERAALLLRFRLDGGEPLAQAEVAARIGHTRQTTCQIQGRALRRLRAMLGVDLP